MELIDYDSFARLRLADFAPPGSEIAGLRDWEYEEDLWVGEGLRFTEFLRLADDPGFVRSIALDLRALPATVSLAILARVGLPLRPGVPAAEVSAALGEPVRVDRFVAAQETLVYRCGADSVYDISCTVTADEGLVYLTMLAPTPRRLAAELNEA